MHPDRSLVAEWLRAIPQSRHDPIPLNSLPHGERIGRALAVMLEMWGAVELSAAGIRAVSQSAYYLLHSLAAWLETKGHVIEDWSEEHGARANEGLKHGASLVFLLEQARWRRFADAPPIRVATVAEVLIVRPGQPPQFLVQWDERAEQFQVIGGRRKDDRDWIEPIEQTAIRELEEELHHQVSYQRGDFSLVFLAEFEGEKRLSPSFGALTAYHFSFFQALNLPPIQLGPLDRWVTREELIRGATADGKPVRGNHILPLEERLGHRIDTLPSSFQA